MSGEIYSYLVPKLLSSGALDVYLTEIMMKKNRPGIKLSVLAKEEKIEELEEIIFRETTTLGIRKYKMERKALEREFIELDSKWGLVTIKAAFSGKELINYAPEYEECKKIAKDFKLPLLDVYTELKALAKDRLEDGAGRE